ncbi:MAG: DUF4419 domain-containing protein [Prevotellaceae bacterium]|jgi:hypothetical protein|nr:DUF4419 domain-containing protein [Prevotellaceae bacterium]
MKKIFFILLICFAAKAYCQKEITFSVEDLSKPESLFPTKSAEKIWEDLIFSEDDLTSSKIGNERRDFKSNIIAKSKISNRLVSFGYQSFFNGMYSAYADHRPFVLSPDMIWLLISQGFAQHVNANPEKLRNLFVDFSGKLSLLVSTTKSIDNVDWENIFPQFTQQIAAHTKNDLIELLSADFSTTTPTEKIASEITIMEAMKPYFEYIVFRIVCGIPKITLKGTTEDWQKILDKTKQLSKYDLEWWTDELEPILEEFVKASQEKIDKDFWRNMFKYHSQEKYGAPNIIDGWIIKFFPYDKWGNRNNLKELKGHKNLPEEIVKVDLKFEEWHPDTTITIPLELWAGFIGLEQNPKDFALTPKIGWMIKKKDVEQKLENEKSKSNKISIIVNKIPDAIFTFDEIDNLEIKFIDKIIIPEQLAKIKINRLDISGNIEQQETIRIINMFPNTELRINNKIYYQNSDKIILN